MRAAVCKSYGTELIIQDIELSDPGPGEVLIRNKACAICHSDIAYIKGSWGEFPPTVFGHEVSGVVEAVGEGVDGFAAGDTVLVSLIRSCGVCSSCQAENPVRCGEKFPLDEASPYQTSDGEPLHQGLRTGGFAEHVLVHESQVVKIPEDMDFAPASVIACAVVTGIGAVTNTARMPVNQNVVVIGAGGVGLNTIQGAALFDPKLLIGVDISDDKLLSAREFGATDTVNGMKLDPVNAVMELTEGKGADYIYVTVGSPKAAEQAFAMAATGSTIVLVGMPPTGAEIPVDASTIAAAEVSILGSKMGSTVLQRDVPRILDWYAEGRIKLDELVTGRFELGQINKALASSEDPSSIRNVIFF